MFLFNLFKKKPKLVKRVSRGYIISMSEKLDKKLKKEGLYVSLVCANDRPSCVQLTKKVNGKNTYICSLKKYLGVKRLKNGNVCDFSPNNLVY